MTDGTPTPLPQPGWYADYAGGPGLRYWDGRAWTDHVSTPVAPQPDAGSAQPYTSTATIVSTPEAAVAAANNPFIWIYAALPVLYLISYLLFPWQQLLSAVESSVSSGGSGQIDTSAYAAASPLVTLLSWGAIGLSILFAILDWNRLRKSGVERPFHWAFVFFVLVSQPSVYMIGRTVITRRRTGKGLGPLWLFIVVQLAAWITFIVLLASFVSTIVATVGSDPSVGSFS